LRCLHHSQPTPVVYAPVAGRQGLFPCGDEIMKSRGWVQATRGPRAAQSFTHLSLQDGGHPARALLLHSSGKLTRMREPVTLRSLSLAGRRMTAVSSKRRRLRSGAHSRDAPGAAPGADSAIATVLSRSTREAKAPRAFQRQGGHWT
jgi:hypothetical protein